MHEASLMTGLMRRIADIAAAEGAPRVTRVAVWLGALSHFSTEHFAEHFAAASRGTPAEGAVLAVTESRDIEDARAQEVVIESVEVET
jgi:hydrogenase nickel incorporation protein HypA/HybF